MISTPFSQNLTLYYITKYGNYISNLSYEKLLRFSYECGLLGDFPFVRILLYGYIIKHLYSSAMYVDYSIYAESNKNNNSFYNNNIFVYKKVAYS